MGDLPPHLWHESFVREGAKKTGGPNLRLLRLAPDEPANTVTAYIFNKFVHPDEDRYITPREAARLQQFPDEHEFHGPITHVQMQIGNAVPVGLAKAVAGHIRSKLSQPENEGKPEAISLFSGAGGLDLGMQEHFSIRYANELNASAAATLRANFPEAEVIEADVSSLSGDDFAMAKRPKLVFGGPPCQPFSAAGKQHGVSDSRGALVSEFLRLVGEIGPDYFVMENVPGLVSNAGGGAMKFIESRASEEGYRTEHYILDATRYGVPQRRRRLFIFGQKKELHTHIGAPEDTHFDPGEGDTHLFLPPCLTVREAFEGLPPANDR